MPVDKDEIAGFFAWSFVCFLASIGLLIYGGIQLTKPEPTLTCNVTDCAAVYNSQKSRVTVTLTLHHLSCQNTITFTDSRYTCSLTTNCYSYDPPNCLKLTNIQPATGFDYIGGAFVALIAAALCLCTGCKYRDQP